MRTKAIKDLGCKATRCLLAVALAFLGLVGVEPERAYADEATIYVSDEHLDFTQYDSYTDNTWSDTFMYINGEVVMCIDITESVVDGASYWAEGMDADMAMRIGLYDRYLWEAYPGWGDATHYGYLQYMIWCEYTPGYMDAYVTPGPSDFWDVYGAAKSYYESNKGNFEAWGTEWHSSSSQNVCVIARLVELGSVELTKTSGSKKLTDYNGCYSLEGAVYGIYSDSGCTDLVDSMTTDADGYAYAGHLKSGDYWVKEIDPSPGYAKDPNPYPVSVSAGQTASVNGGTVVEIAKSDPVGMLVVKADKDLGCQPQGSASLEGAEFTVAFYKGQYSTAAEAEASGAADSTWVFKTDADGFCYLAEEYKVSGPDFYYQSNGTTPTLPLGTVVIQETKAPEGYLLDNGNGGEPEKFCIRITDDGAVGESVYSYNTCNVPETAICGGVDVRKIDRETGDVPQGDATLAGAVLDIVNWSENPVVVDGGTYAKGEVCKSIAFEYDAATDTYVASCRGCLPYGSYEIHESAAPEGYLLTEGWSEEFSISTDGEVVSLTADVDALSDDVIRGGVKVNKADEQTGLDPQGDATFEGAVFDIVNESEAAVVVDGEAYDPGEVVATIVTKLGSGGMAIASTSASLLPYGTYRIVEVQAPEGYLNTGTIERPFQVREDGVIVDLTETPIENDVIRGGVKINKSDEQTGLDPQGDATFVGAEFSIINVSEHAVLVDGETYQPGEVCKVIVTAIDGDAGLAIAKTASDCLPYGSYELDETKAPEGYLNTGSIHREFQICEDGTVVDLTDEPVSNDVIRGGVRVEKDDLELGKSEAIGGKEHASAEGACLAGIEFTIVNESENAVQVGGELYQPGETVETILTAWSDELGVYVAETPADELPYGTYTIQETATNKSYLLTDGEPRTFQIREDGMIVEADTQGVNLVFNDQVIRNDMELSKKADDTNAAIQAAFLVTNTETGEAHVLVCDRNGDASTAASWNPHTRNTNANDKLIGVEDVKASDFDTSAGIWFGLGENGSMAEPDDGLGAMPYGHYTIEELRSDSNAGYELVERELWITRDATVARAVWMSLDDQPSERIRTQAANAADGDSFVDAGEQVTVKDTVFYENLRTDGREYTVEGALMLKSDNAPLLDAEGNPVTASKTFKPASSTGTVELEFTFNASLLAGETVVVFEDLMADGKLVATHADINDEGQSVKVVRIRTTATNEAGGKTVTGSTVAIVDEVAYEGLTPGEAYTLKAVLMDAETGKPVQRAGGLFPEDVTAGAEFAAEAASGKATVTLECNVSELGGHRLVVFEELYGPDGGKVTEHKDITDEGQTVTVVQICTTATDSSDGDHVIESGKAKIVDTVEYKGLTPGEAYTMNGTLMVKSTGEVLVGADGKPVTASAEFTPEKADGTVEMAFEFDATELEEGTELVVFEECLDANGDIVAEHKDIDDAGQTVVVDNPDTPETPDTPKPGLPKTGDSAPLIPATCLVAAAACAAGIAGLARRREGESSDRDLSEE